MGDLVTIRDPAVRECPVCHGSFTATRSHQIVCSATCRQRKRRGTYVVTAEDRAAIRRVLERDGCGHPRDTALTPDEVHEHVVLTARRT